MAACSATAVNMSRSFPQRSPKADAGTPPRADPTPVAPITNPTVLRLRPESSRWRGSTGKVMPMPRNGMAHGK